ncbi:uncharacterized protein LOC135432342 [Drosophila montana]|uniref:uncharacterized protein LOC135432342 n=1 Tax=Drosophila montana TaxID=40370 RepID=UPI00313C10B1
MRHQQETTAGAGAGLGAGAGAGAAGACVSAGQTRPGQQRQAATYKIKSVKGKLWHQIEDAQLAATGDGVELVASTANTQLLFQFLPRVPVTLIDTATEIYIDTNVQLLNTACMHERYSRIDVEHVPMLCAVGSCREGDVAA